MTSYAVLLCLFFFIDIVRKDTKLLITKGILTLNFQYICMVLTLSLFGFIQGKVSD